MVVREVCTLSDDSVKITLNVYTCTPNYGNFYSKKYVSEL